MDDITRGSVKAKSVSSKNPVTHLPTDTKKKTVSKGAISMKMKATSKSEEGGGGVGGVGGVFMRVLC